MADYNNPADQAQSQTLYPPLEPAAPLAVNPAVAADGSPIIQSTGVTLVSSAPAQNTAPLVIDVPHVYQDGGNLVCTMGNWTGEPTQYTYQWRNMTADVWHDVAGATADSYAVTPEMVGQTVLCDVTAANEAGHMKVTSNPLIVIAPVTA